MKCLRDIWSQFGDSAEFELEVSGVPPPRIQWYLNDKLIVEGEDSRLCFTKPAAGIHRLRVRSVQERDLGVYAAQAENPNGQVKSTATLLAGDPFDASRQQSVAPDIQFGGMFKVLVINIFLFLEDAQMDEDELMDFDDENQHGHRHLRHHVKRKGVAPEFVVGLSDMEVR